MGSRITPMIHVPDVSATANWYRSVGFTLAGWHACDGDGLGQGPLPSGVALDWAMLGWGDGRIMLNAGGVGSDAARREVDLYIDLDPASGEGVDALFDRLKSKIGIVEAPHDAFHGNRELIVRDNNGFRITFAEPVGGQ
jgi:uncharacterized glyoxalase superfamily protein PhnB